MERIETSSTSAKTAECTPVVLRQTSTTRLLFCPVPVENDKQPRACIHGEFVFERKGKNDEWQPVERESLATVKRGEQYKLELHAAELLELMETLGPLYKLQWTRNKWGLTAPPRGNQVFVKLEAGLARFMQLGQAELEQFLSTHTADALTMLGKLVQWVSAGNVSSDALKILGAMDPSKLPAISSLLGLSTLKSALEEWETNKENSSEQYWQDLLSKHSFVLSQLFARPIVIIRERAYLGGKTLDDKGGSYLDFLVSSAVTNSVILVEIKTPRTDLLGPIYRGGVYPPSTDLGGGVAQILKYRRTLSASFATLTKGSESDLVMGGMPCLVIAGNAEREFDAADKRESFEAYRDQLVDVHVVTYDELFAKLRTSVELLEGLSAAAADQESAVG